LFVQGWLLFYK